VITDPDRFEEAAIRRALDAAKGDISRFLDVLRRLVDIRRHGICARDLEREMGRYLLQTGEPLLAYDAVTGALRQERAKPGDRRLPQLRGLALARLGETRRAWRELKAVASEPHDDAHLLDETAGILARTYKNLGFQCPATNPARARSYWQCSFRHYEDPYAKTGSYYTGINAATLSLSLAAPRKARLLAERVSNDCLKRWKTTETGLASPPDDPYWLAATMGEAALLQGHAGEAARWYHEVGKIGRRDRRFGDMDSTRGQLATILIPELHLDPSELDKLFAMPRVSVFAGHMIDRPGRSRPRFAPHPESEDRVKAAIRARLDEQHVSIGYS
jgi:hypothetical protein